MAEFRPLSFSRSEWGLFSSEELGRLMRVEFQRAERYQYDLLCLAVAVDRLGHLHDLYGYDSKSEILEAVIGMMKTATRDSDFPRCLYEDHLLALFPYTPPDGGLVLVKRLLRNVRNLKFESEGRVMQITLSIGLANSRDPGIGSFEGLMQRCQTGLALARAAGGDRWMKAEQVEGEIDGIRAELEALRRELDERARLMAEAEQVGRTLAALESSGAGAGAVQLALEHPQDRELAQRVHALFVMSGGPGGDLASLESAVVALALKVLHEERRRSIGARLEPGAMDVDLLERRIAKLTRALGTTEEELRRVMAQKSVDPGVASMYKTVQGLSAQAHDAERKLAMLSTIYEANLELRKRLQTG